MCNPEVSKEAARFSEHVDLIFGAINKAFEDAAGRMRLEMWRWIHHVDNPYACKDPHGGSGYPCTEKTIFK
jgi:hypothetical protein